LSPVELRALSGKPIRVSLASIQAHLKERPQIPFDLDGQEWERLRIFRPDSKSQGMNSISSPFPSALGNPAYASTPNIQGEEL
jgi:hypothetical protein